MSNILEELWYGNIVPCKDVFRNSEKVKELLYLVMRNRDELSATLSEKQKEILEKYDDCTHEMQNIYQREIFSCGFRLGARIAGEVLGGEV